MTIHLPYTGTIEYALLLSSRGLQYLRAGDDDLYTPTFDMRYVSYLNESID